MFAVIAIHVTSVYIDNSRSLFAINQLSRFAVPLFVLLSGISLSISEERTPSQLIARLVPPYLLWCVVYSSVLTPHLYFVVVIVQMYILFPFLKKLKERNPCFLFGGAIVCGLAFTGISWLSELGIELRPEFIRTRLWYLFPVWIAYFVAGLYVTRSRLEKALVIVRRHAVVLLIAAVLLAVLYAIEARYTKTAGSSIKPSLFIYTPVCFAAFCGLGASIEKFSFLKRAVSFAARHSLTVYFCHVKFLELLRPLELFHKMGGIASAVLQYALCAGLSLTFAALFDSGIKRLSKTLAAR
jgi:surface polysaccharide O-acyltransferase-like enzyme